MDDRTVALASQVERLACEVRWHRRAASIVLLAVAGSVVARGEAAAPRTPAELRAVRFVLVAADGSPLAALEASAEDGPQLALSGRGAVHRAVLGLAADGAPRLYLNDAAGGRRAVLEVAGEEGRVSVLGPGKSMVALMADIAPRVAIADAKGTDRLWLAVRRGSPVLQFMNAAGQPRSGLATINDESGMAVISGADGKTPGLVLYDKKRAIVWSAP